MTLTWQQQWMEMVQVLGEWNDIIELIPWLPTYLHSIHFIQLYHRTFYDNNHDQLLPKRRHWLSSWFSVSLHQNVKCLHKIMLRACAAAVSKFLFNGARYSKNGKLACCHLELNSGFLDPASSALTTEL